MTVDEMLDKVRDIGGPLVHYSRIFSNVKAFLEDYKVRGLEELPKGMGVRLVGTFWVGDSGLPYILEESKVGSTRLKEVGLTSLKHGDHIALLEPVEEDK